LVPQNAKREGRGRRRGRGGTGHRSRVERSSGLTKAPSRLRYTQPVLPRRGRGGNCRLSVALLVLASCPNSAGLALAFKYSALSSFMTSH
jgi:hypothetical protein